MKLLFTIFCILFSSTVFTQLHTTYTMGIISSSTKNSVNTNPITLAGFNCIKVNSGLSKFLSSNNGVFFNECIVNLNYIKLNIQVAPNPVNTFTIIKFKDKISFENNFKLTVVNEIGSVMKVENITQDNFLYGGYKLYFTDYPTGFYFINISSNKIFESFKILKN